jgi:hypothetical protein
VCVRLRAILFQPGFAGAPVTYLARGRDITWHSGYRATIANRSFMTHNVILPPSNNALQMSQLSSLMGQEHGRTVPLADMRRTSTVKS